MRYYGTVVRPPSEAGSYILQVTYGCSHNECIFCCTYLDKPFEVRPANEVMEDIRMAGSYIPDTRRVFLADGNALVLSNRRLVPILDALGETFPMLERVGIYGNAQDILRKTENELRELLDRKLSIVYLGLESGNDEVLLRAKKGATAQEMIEAVRKAQDVGLTVSVIAVLGLGGVDLWEQHAIDTGRAVSEMDPAYFSLLSLMVVPGTELYRLVSAGDFVVPEPLEMLQEMRVIIEHIEGVSHCVFRTNHASNYLPLAGTLPQDKERLLLTIDRALAEGQSVLRPEYLRAL
ncbi:MAG: radical SAM protein [Anaerolineae bacterium]|nr:radical SAM protein [Anaerolineae bacterium]NIN94608.1 radical SAM protein [Anaerolineae bacterium]NIQ77664.1 radical SAM protein [Anaerolineae bacterium]